MVRVAIVSWMMITLAACGQRPRPGPMWTESSAAKAEDFDAMWQQVSDRYCYFDSKRTDWPAVRDHYRPLAIAADSVPAFIAVLESALDELYDPHSHLDTNLGSSWRLPAHDLWAEPADDGAIITDVLRGSAADRAGVVPGMVVRSIDGAPVADAIAARRPRFATGDPAADHWALLSALSGQHDRGRVLVVDAPDGFARTIEIDDLGHARPDEPAVTARLLDGGVLHVRIASFADAETVDEVDRALDAHRDARALVFDVRANPGGDTAVARPIMGRLIGEQRQYASMARRDGAGLGERWPEYVEPRGPWTFTGPVVVVVDRWSTSMAEGFAMGLDGMERATVVGTRMAGLGAGVESVTLPHSQIGVQFSAEPVYQVSGAPRDVFEPAVLVAPRGDGDAALDAALDVLSAP